MSLTSFIKISPVKAVFRKEFPLKQIKLVGKMKAEPVTRNFIVTSRIMSRAEDVMFFHQSMVPTKICYQHTTE